MRSSATPGGARRTAAALVAMTTTLAAGVAIAGPAAATDRTTGHFDVAAEIECDAFGTVVDVEAHLHEHAGGGHAEVPDGDWLAFGTGGSAGPAVGLAVETDTCDDVEVTFVPRVLDASSTGGTVTGTGAGTSISASRTSATGAVTLVGEAHQDLSWSFSTAGTYVLSFDVTVDGTTTVVSEALPLKNG